MVLYGPTMLPVIGWRRQTASSGIGSAMPTVDLAGPAAPARGTLCAPPGTVGVPRGRRQTGIPFPDVG